MQQLFLTQTSFTFILNWGLWVNLLPRSASSSDEGATKKKKKHNRSYSSSDEEESRKKKKKLKSHKKKSKKNKREHGKNHKKKSKKRKNESSSSSSSSSSNSSDNDWDAAVLTDATNVLFVDIMQIWAPHLVSWKDRMHSSLKIRGLHHHTCEKNFGEHVFLCLQRIFRKKNQVVLIDFHILRVESQQQLYIGQYQEKKVWLYNLL